MYAHLLSSSPGFLKDLPMAHSEIHEITVVGHGKFSWFFQVFLV